MQELTITLSIEKLNTVLTALAKQPFEQVVELINEIQKQAAPQLKAPEEAAPVKVGK